MVKKIIAVDIDDVLASSAAGFVAYSNERWGTDLAPDDYDEHWGKMWNVDHAEVVRRSKDVYLASVHGQFKSREDALPVLRKLTEKYELVIATSRHRLLEPTTLEWLDLHYSGIFSNVHFAGIWDKGLHLDKSIHMTKGDLLSTIKADYMIDDQPKHCIAAAHAGINAVLFGEYPWSTSLELPDGVTRAKDWQAVEEYFNEAR